MTHPFDSILLVTLGTPFDLGAERIAVAVAESRKRPLMAIVPLGAPEFEAQALESVAKAEEEANARLAVLAEETRKVGIEFDAHVRRGEEPWREILDEARERKADLIVCRRYGRLGFLASLLVWRDGDERRQPCGVQRPHGSAQQPDVATEDPARDRWCAGLRTRGCGRIRGRPRMPHSDDHRLGFHGRH